jgi:hypothetical protein
MGYGHLKEVLLLCLLPGRLNNGKRCAPLYLELVKKVQHRRQVGHLAKE